MQCGIIHIKQFQESNAMNKKKNRKIKNRNSGKAYRFSFFIALSIFLSTIIITSIYLNLTESPERIYVSLPYKTDELNQILYRDKIIPVHKEVELNKYDKNSFYMSGDRMGYDDGQVKSIFGIDVSEFQGNIDWQKVKNDGVEFAMLRAGFRGYGSGVINIDGEFLNNLKEARNNNIDVGVYFYSQAISVEEAREEARVVIGWLMNYDIQYPVVFDWESTGDPIARTENIDPSVLNDCANAFCQEIANAGYTPIIYFYRDLAYLYYDLSKINSYDFWLAEYNEIPTFHYDFKMLQFTNKGRIDGIHEGKDDVDLNISFIDYSRQTFSELN